MTSSLIRQIVVVSLVAITTSEVVSAQLIAPPRRQPRRAPAPNPNLVSHDLTLGVSVLGGYDKSSRNSSAPLPSPVGAPGVLVTPWPSVYLGLLDADMSYQRTSAKRSLGLDGRGYVNAYKNVGSKPNYGGDVSINGQTALGRRNSARAFVGAQKTPFYSAGFFGPLTGVGGNPTAGFANGTTWTLGTGGSFNREWTRNTTTTLAYEFLRHGYGGSTTVGTFQNESHSGSVDVRRSLGRRAATRAGIKHTINSNIQAGGGFLDITHDDIDGGLSYSRDVSRTRQLTLSGGGGGSYVQSPSYLGSPAYKYWTPLAYTSATIDLARSWSLSADYRRSVAVPSALRQQQIGYVTHNSTLGLGGNLSSRIQLAISGIYTRGQTGVVSVANGAARYEAYAGTGQLQFRLTDSWSAMLNAGHVQTHTNASASQALGIFPQLERTQFRVGFSWLFPLMGQGGRRN